MANGANRVQPVLAGLVAAIGVACGSWLVVPEAIAASIATRASPASRRRGFHGAVVAHLDVSGLQIAVDDAVIVRRLEGLGDLPRDPEGLGILWRRVS